MRVKSIAYMPHLPVWLVKGDACLRIRIGSHGNIEDWNLVYAGQAIRKALENLIEGRDTLSLYERGVRL